MAFTYQHHRRLFWTFSQLKLPTRQTRIWFCFLTLSVRGKLDYFLYICLLKSYRTLVAYGSSMSGLHIESHCRKCVEYRCIWSGRQYCTVVIKLRSRTPTLDKRVARSRLLNIFAGAWDVFSGRAASEHVRKSILLYIIQLVLVLWIGTKLYLTC